MRFTFLFCLLLAITAVVAQDVETFEVDSSFGIIKKSLPFDKSFVLRYYIKPGHDVSDVFLLKHKAGKGYAGSILADKHLKDSRKPSTTFFEFPEAFIKRSTDGKYVDILFSRTSSKILKDGLLLQPAHRYNLIIGDASVNAALVQTVVSMFYDYHSLIASGKNPEAATKLNDIHDFVEKEYLKDVEILGMTNNSFIDQGTLGAARFAPMDALYLTGKKTDFDNWRIKSAAIPGKVSTEAGNYTTTTFDSDARAFIASIPASGFSLLHCADTCQLLKILTALFNLDATGFTAVLAGTHSITEDWLKGGTMVLASRISNVNTSMASLKALQDQVDYLSLSQTVYNGSTFSTNLAALRTSLKTIKDELEAVRDANASLISAAAAAGLTIKKDYSTIEGNTDVFNFQTRLGFWITPEFGFAMYGFQTKQPNRFFGFMPYVGFHMNFRYINRDIPFWKMPNKTVWHFLSFNFAWTLVGIDEPNKRKNFFKASALMTGLGLRLSDYVRISSGVVWFYKDDPNPVINNYHLGITPYLGISLDMAIADLVKGIKDLIPVKP